MHSFIVSLCSIALRRKKEKQNEIEFVGATNFKADAFVRPTQHPNSVQHTSTLAPTLMHSDGLHQAENMLHFLCKAFAEAHKQDT